MVNNHQSTLFISICCLATIGLSSAVFAAELDNANITKDANIPKANVDQENTTDTVIPKRTEATIDYNANIDHVLSELTRQHENASVLVKSARQPASLALNSPLINAQPKINTDILITQNHPDEDVLKRLTAVASNSVSRFKQSGIASWYGEKFQGQTTASGERFNMNDMTAAHPFLPFNSYLKVTNKSNGQSVVVKVNDRAPTNTNRMLDLSYAAASEIGLATSGVGNVTIERIYTP